MKLIRSFSARVAIAFLLASGIFFIACNNQPTAEAVTADSSVVAPDMIVPATRFTVEAVDNRKDPACGMPVTAGIHDTMHYRQNVLGFCSVECKAVFEKSPEQYIAAADLKKK